jgi:hypothetical protein
MSDSSAGSAVAVMGAMVVGAAAVGMATYNRWGETPAQEKARIEAEQRYDAIEAGKPPKKARAPRAPNDPELRKMMAEAAARVAAEQRAKRALESRAREASRLAASGRSGWEGIGAAAAARSAVLGYQD